MIKVGDTVLISTATRTASPVHDDKRDKWVPQEVSDVTYEGYGNRRAVTQVYISDGYGPRWIQRRFFKEQI